MMISSMVEPLRNEFSDTISQFQCLNPGQLRRLFEFVNPSFIDLDLGIMAKRIHEIESKELLSLVEYASQTFPQLETTSVAQPKPDQSKKNLEQLEFTQLYHLIYLRRVVRETSQNQLLLLMGMIRPPKGYLQRLQILQGCQQILAMITEEMLAHLHATISSVSLEYPGTEAQQLSAQYQLPNEYFYLYDFLLSLLKFPLDELLHLQTFFPQWEFLHLVHVTCLSDLEVEEVFEIITMVLGDDKIPDSLCPISLPLHGFEIIAQPPERFVYKRNLTPIPTVMVNLGPAGGDNFYIVPKLIRRDTGEEILNNMLGADPVKAVSGRPILFKNIKILTTARKCGDTAFALKFELRLYHNNLTDYELISSITSNPIHVVSHKSLIPVRQNLPEVTEVIPFSGPTSGLTRVVILGKNFIESPTARVKFDNTEVVPFFHGPKTLICCAPQHISGNVSVTVCNYPKEWSTSSAKFTYYDTPDGEKKASFNILNIKIETDTPSASTNDSDGDENIIDTDDSAFSQFDDFNNMFSPFEQQTELVGFL